jgi:hypothetical protein
MEMTANKNTHPELQALTGLAFEQKVGDEERRAAAAEDVATVPGFAELTDDEENCYAGEMLVRIVDEAVQLVCDRLVDYYNGAHGSADRRAVLTVSLAMETFGTVGGMFSAMTEPAAMRNAQLMSDYVRSLPEKEQRVIMEKSKANTIRMLGQLLGGR